MIKRVYRTRPEPGWYYIYDLYVGGRRVRTPRGEAFPTKQECVDAVSSIRTDYRRGKYQFPADRSTVTIAELKAAWITRLKELARSPSYIMRAGQSLDRLEKISASPVIDLKTYHLEKLFSSRIQAGTKVSTVYSEMATIMTALNNAGALFSSLEDWRPPKKPKVCVPNPEGRQRVITHEEERRIIEALLRPWGKATNFDRKTRAQAARIFWLALRTGMRLGEIFGLLKTSVSFDRGVKMEHGWIEVRRSRSSEHTKTKKSRVIPMSATVAALMKEQISANSSRFVFPKIRDNQQPTAAVIDVFKPACVIAKIQYGNRKPGGVVFHDTRHTAATRMLLAGNDLKTVANILGHSDVYMTMRYAHATAESRQAAVRSLEDGEFGRFESKTASNSTQTTHSNPKLRAAKK